MDNFYFQLRNFKNVIIFGLTTSGINVLEGIRKIFKDINIYFCDNDKSKQNHENDMKCYSVEDAVKIFPDAAFVVISEYYRKEKAQQLIELGISEGNIVYGLPKDVSVQIKEDSHKRKIKKLTVQEFHFEINIVKHCNLNCRGCNHFSPLANNDFMAVSIIEKDVKRVGELFNHVASRIFLLGGEPLLHPQIVEIIKICRKNFPKTKIHIVTNGILLAKMSESFWNCCKEHNIVISPTKYPINIDYDSLGELADRHGVEYSIFGGTDVCARTLWFEPIDIQGQHDVNEEFFQCRQANQCITLEKGRLYTCVVPPNIASFNSYFGCDLEVSDEDGIDIYKAESCEEILEFFTHPIPFCKYCDWEHHAYDNPWEISRKDIKEWTL